MSVGAELVAALRDRGVELWLEDGRLRYRAPVDVDREALLVVLRKLKRELRGELLQGTWDRVLCHLLGLTRCVRCGTVDLGRPSAVCGWCQDALAPGWWERHGADSSRGTRAGPIENAPVTRVTFRCPSCGGGKVSCEIVCGTCRACRDFPGAGTIQHSEQPVLVGAST